MNELHIILSDTRINAYAQAEARFGQDGFQRRWSGPGIFVDAEDTVEPALAHARVANEDTGVYCLIVAT